MQQKTLIWDSNENFFTYLSLQSPETSRGIFQLIALNRMEPDSGGGTYLHDLAKKETLTEAQLKAACKAGGDFNTKNANGKSVWDELRERRTTHNLPFKIPEKTVLIQASFNPSEPYWFGMELMEKIKTTESRLSPGKEAIFYGSLLSNSPEKKFLILEKPNKFELVSITKLQQNWQRVRQDARHVNLTKASIVFPHITQNQALPEYPRLTIDKKDNGFPVYICNGEHYIEILREE